MNNIWIDPREIDWTDALNPLRVPGWAEDRNPYAWQALRDPIFQALRLAKGIEPRIYVCPDPQAQLLQPGTTYDYEVPSEPNCWLWALNASSSVGDFLVQVTDSGTGAKLLSQPVTMTELNAIANGTSARGPLSLLSTPHLFEPPSYPVVRLTNTNASAQICVVTLFCCVEYDLS